MKIINLLFALLITFNITACTSAGGTKQSVGGLTGAALGGLLGSQFGSGKGQLATTGAGVLIGGLIGSEIGYSMDELDRMKANRAIRTSYRAPLGETIRWNNPDSGNYGTVTPTKDGTSSKGNYCREFQQSVTISGRTEQAYGVACRQPDGSWRIVE